MPNEIPKSDEVESGHVSDVVPCGEESTGQRAPQTDKSLFSSMAETGHAPSCPMPIVAPPRPVTKHAPDVLEAGEKVDDFEILGKLGRGAFGAVYLARQISLDRQVALKVTVWQPSEGRKMAQLEHDHIVQVFSESVDLSGMRRLLCMQYVPGPTLQSALDEVHAESPDLWTGKALIAAIDKLTVNPASFDPSSLRNREILRESDWGDAVCWIGARLAEALDYAHSHDVIHRDIKPGNIMLSQYGRPMLVDFNMAAQPLAAETSGSSDPIGGTLAYMAPEHIDAFNSDGNVQPGAVAESSDIYSLGVVLYQMLTARLPFPKNPVGSNTYERLRAMSAERRKIAPALPPRYSLMLDRVIARCLHPDRQLRYASGRELSAALEGCRQFHRAEDAMPATGRFMSIVLQHPVAWMLLLAFAPHIIGTITNITYNQIRIISHLTTAQQHVFIGLIVGYDLVAYSLGIILARKIVTPVYRAWPLARSRLPAEGPLIDEGRRTALRWPNWAMGIACLGWLPGGFLFPLGLAIFAGPLPSPAWTIWSHLIISFTISGLISLTYSALFVQWMALCVFYPRMWTNTGDFQATAKTELSPIPSRLRLLQVLSGVIPLAGAILTTVIGQHELSAAENLSFRILVAVLIVLGMAGSQWALFATGRLSLAVDAMTTGRIRSKSSRSL